MLKKMRVTSANARKQKHTDVRAHMPMCFLGFSPEQTMRE